MPNLDGTVLDRGGALHNVRSTAYLAKGDARIVANVAVSGSPLVNVTVSGSAPFVAGDVGKRIRIAEAGASGASHSSTILSVVSASQVTLAAAAATGVTGKSLVYGTDDSAAINAAISTAYVNGGGVVFIPAGTYLLGSRIDLKRYVSLVGAGRGASILRLDYNGYAMLYDDGTPPDLLPAGYIDIRDLALVGGDETQQVSTNYPAVKIKKLTSVNISRCLFDQFRHTSALPVVLWDFGIGSSIDGSYFNNLRRIGVQLYNESNNNRFIGNSFSALPSAEGSNAVGMFLDYMPPSFKANQSNVIIANDFEGHDFGVVGLTCGGSACTLIALITS